MTSNSIGKIFSFTTWGESHGKAIGCVIDGVPSNIRLTERDIQPFLDRRKPGQSKYTTQRKEEDRIQILSGRLKLLKWMQTFSSISFLFNLITIFFGFVGLQNFALVFFIISVALLIIAMSLFIVESQQSHYALSLHIRDLEIYNKNKISTS